MAVGSSASKKNFYLASLVGVFFFAVWFLLLVYLGTHSPTVPDEAAGRIYAYNYHGTLVYLDLTEQLLRYALPGAGFMTFAILVIVERYLKGKDKRWPPMDTYEH